MGSWLRRQNLFLKKGSFPTQSHVSYMDSNLAFTISGCMSKKVGATVCGQLAELRRLRQLASIFRDDYRAAHEREWVKTMRGKFTHDDPALYSSLLPHTMME